MKPHRVTKRRSTWSEPPRKVPCNTATDAPLLGNGDLKFLGWHCNNDGIRVNAGSEVSHSFLWCVDDHFYNFNIHAHDLVLDNVSVEAQFGRSRVKGAANAAQTGVEAFLVRNILIRNLRIGGRAVRAENAADSFEIDPATTRDIVFAADAEARRGESE